MTWRTSEALTGECPGRLAAERDAASFEGVDCDCLEVGRDAEMVQLADQRGSQLRVDQRAEDRHAGHGADLAAGVRRRCRHA
jgi:hypothetical protein